MAVLLPSLGTSGAREGSLITWLPEDIFWFEFPDGVPADLLNVEKFHDSDELVGILKESYETGELYLDMFDNFLGRTNPAWWEGLSQQERLGVLAGLRGYLGVEYELRGSPEMIGGFSTLDMAAVLGDVGWKHTYWAKMVPWEAVIAPVGAMDSRQVQTPEGRPPGSFSPGLGTS